MSYRSLTIRKSIDRLNRKFFLPSLQREFVWKDKQIIRLFDSIMRGYPIGSFLFWQPRGSAAKRWTSYKFLMEIRDGGSHSPLANLSSIGRPIFVLDGQQRLTALNIGLRGIYNAKEKYKRRNNPDAYKPKRLFIDLLRRNGADKASDEDTDTHFRFSFMETLPVPTKRVCWFEVGEILHCPTPGSLQKKTRQVLRSLPRSASFKSRQAIRATLKRLQAAVFSDPVIFYHTETLPDYVRALDIFVRANEAGTRLTKSDLLLSTLIANWEHEDARKEIHDFVDRLNDRLARKNDLDKDFVVKSCFVLCDLPVKYKITSFTRKNLKTVESKWPEVKGALEKCVRLVNSFGIDGENLTSANALIPVAYYLFHNSRENLLGSSRWECNNASAIRRWLVMALLNRVFSGSSDTMLASLRDVLQKHGRHGKDFPVDRLNVAIVQRGHSAGFSDGSMDALLKLEYGEDNTFLALTLLYDDTSWGTMPHNQDHIFPKKEFSEARLRRAGVPDGDFSRYIELKNRIGNLELLNERENKQKHAQDFGKWVRTRSSAFRRKHLIPLSRNLYSLRRYEKFLQHRERLIRTRLRNLFR